jgi:hypothetical protein
MQNLDRELVERSRKRGRGEEGNASDRHETHLNENGPEERSQLNRDILGKRVRKLNPSSLLTLHESASERRAEDAQTAMRH